MNRATLLPESVMLTVMLVIAGAALVVYGLYLLSRGDDGWMSSLF